MMHHSLPRRRHRVPYWLLWHMALGVSKFLIYDNDDLHLRHDSLDEAQLRTVLDAFIREGYVELVPFSGPSHEGGQFRAYHNAVGRARAGGERSKIAEAQQQSTSRLGH